MKIVAMMVLSIMLFTLSSCVSGNINNSNKANSSTSASTSPNPQIEDTNNKSNSEYPKIANEKIPSINRNLVGDPMETYFSSDAYKTKLDPKSQNPIYAKESFVKGTYPLDEDIINYETARVIIIQFKEDIDFNYLFNKEKPAIRVIYGSHGKDITQAYNFTYDSVTQKLLITSKSVGNGFGSHNFMEIILNGDNLCTSEIQDADIKYSDGRTEHIDGQRRRQLSGTYSFKIYTN